ncbi:MAG: GNAT family N-acetyltransferase [Candidatus Thermoplasmatota archaeon]|nr:GNAT family N-acetyltransferase [Candidatus Thermoplasmatota archaeon]
MIIRRAHHHDVKAIQTHNILLAEETEGVILHPDVTLRGVQAVLADETKGFYLIAEDNKTIVGQMLVTREWSDWRNTWIWWIGSIYVQKPWRNRGVFSRLVQSAEQEAKRQNVAFLRLYAHEQNRPALQVYTKQGWVQEPYVMYIREIQG